MKRMLYAVWLKVRNKMDAVFGYRREIRGVPHCPSCSPTVPTGEEMVERQLRRAPPVFRTRDGKKVFLPTEDGDGEDFHWKDCGDVGGGWPHPASAHDK